MKKKCGLLSAALLGMIIPALWAHGFSGQDRNIRQVRVTAERTSVYIEPSRGSTRIDIVGQGTLLNLLQQKKFKESWYYVSFSSPRYGARISGFVLDSAVELVCEETPSAPKEKAVPEKAEEVPLPAPPPPVAPEPPRISESLVPTSLVPGRKFALPRRPAPLLETPWKIEEAAPLVPAKPKPPAVEKPEPPPTPEKKAEAPPREEPAPKPAPREEKAKEPEPLKKPAPPQVLRPARTPAPRRGPGGASFGLGYGSSFGGAGASFQFSTKRGIAVHAGAGIFPTTLVYSETDWVENKLLWSVGLRYYLPVKSPLLYPFVDVQYGGLRVEAAQVVIGVWDYEYVFSREQKALYGPSILSGVEVRKGRFGLCGALGVSYVTTSWEYLQNKVLFSFDASLVVHF